MFYINVSEPNKINIYRVFIKKIFFNKLLCHSNTMSFNFHSTTTTWTNEVFTEQKTTFKNVIGNFLVQHVIRICWPFRNLCIAVLDCHFFISKTNTEISGRCCSFVVQCIKFPFLITTDVADISYTVRYEHVLLFFHRLSWNMRWYSSAFFLQMLRQFHKGKIHDNRLILSHIKLLYRFKLPEVIFKSISKVKTKLKRPAIEVIWCYWQIAQQRVIRNG